MPPLQCSPVLPVLSMDFAEHSIMQLPASHHLASLQIWASACPGGAWQVHSNLCNRSVLVLQLLKAMMDADVCANGYGAQSTYNPMQEPSGIYQYTYNQPADLADDADSSFAQHRGPQYDAGPFAMPGPLSGRGAGADEHNVVSFVSKQVRLVHSACIFGTPFVVIREANTCKHAQACMHTLRCSCCASSG